jgi:hypothetical protein
MSGRARLAENLRRSGLAGAAVSEAFRVVPRDSERVIDMPEADMSEADELLRTAGEVPPPETRVLDAARETLWSAIAEQMLGSQGGPAGRETGWRQPTDVRQG